MKKHEKSLFEIPEGYIIGRGVKREDLNQDRLRELEKVLRHLNCHQRFRAKMRAKREALG